MLESVQLQSCTVDTDHGCAIIRSRPFVSRLSRIAYRALGTIWPYRRTRLLHASRRMGNDRAASFRLLR